VEGNFWNRATTKAEIAEDGLTASNNQRRSIHDVAAEKEFSISKRCRKDHFPGTTFYYFEVVQIFSSEW
jgi:hypothetical protein